MENAARQKVLDLFDKRRLATLRPAGRPQATTVADFGPGA